MAAITHPDCAALVDPLFAFGEKRVKNNFLTTLFTACGREGDRVPIIIGTMIG